MTLSAQALTSWSPPHGFLWCAPEMKARVVVHIGTSSAKNISPALSFRRQRARERQQKLLAEFASRQKSFMETAMDVGKKEPFFLFVCFLPTCLLCCGFVCHGLALKTCIVSRWSQIVRSSVFRHFSHLLFTLGLLRCVIKQSWIKVLNENLLFAQSAAALGTYAVSRDWVHRCTVW